MVPLTDPFSRNAFVMKVVPFSTPAYFDCFTRLAVGFGLASTLFTVYSVCAI